MKNIKLKIQELAKEISSNVSSISYGYKYVGNVQTNELCIIYSVDKKKPISELLESEIIPSTIIIEDKVLKTDVFEMNKPELLICNGACGQNAGANSIPNRTFTRPLVGGLSVTSTNLVTTVGTLGFIGVHINTQTLVGVTNNHVLIQDAFYTAERNVNGAIKNEYTPIDSVYQHGETGSIPPSNFIIGQTLRYVPIQQATPNKVDCSIFSINESDIGLGNISSSVKQAGVAYTDPLPFATTAEIDDLLETNPMLFSSGRTTGPKGGVTCPLRVFALFTAFPINYNKQYIPTQVYFEDQITFVKPEFDPSLTTICSNPIIPGDSGSALIADFGGVRKIVGLVFAASTVGGIIYYGYANRIDNVALEIGIEAWDGTNKNFVDLSSIEYVTTVGGSYNKYINCEQKQLWQVGLTTLFNPCTLPSPISYNCDNGVCIDPLDGSGTYTTLVECETCCIPPPPVTSYNCTNGTCVLVSGSGGQYPTLLACQEDCAPVPPIVSYNCFNGNCIDPGDGSGVYGTLVECDNICTFPPPNISYNCLNGNCTDPLDGSGVYATLIECENICTDPPQISYNCFLGECTDPGDGSGVYPTLIACEEVCVPEPPIPTCSVFINFGNAVYAYFPSSNTNIFLSSFLFFPASPDIAHTTTKLWMYDGLLIYEMDITLNPWSATFNRTIAFPSGVILGAGLGAITNTQLISTNNNVSPNEIIVLDITTSTAVSTIIGTLKPGRTVSGDILLTTTNKILVTNQGVDGIFLSQYSYPSGTFEVEVDITSTIINPWGIFIDSGNIYVCDFSGQMYNVNVNFPYTQTLFNNSGLSISGASQVPSCGNANLIVAPSVTTYNCENCECVSVSGSEGDFPTLQDCIDADCSTGSFITTWQTTTAFESITLPYYLGGTYAGTIDWGDSTTSANSFATSTHIYATPGIYTITICGTTTGWNFQTTPVSKTKIKSVVQWGQLLLGFDAGNYFKGCSNLNLSLVSDTLNLTGITSLSNMFTGCSSITSINNINSWNTGAILNTTLMFSACVSFSQALSFDTSAVTNMQGMFNNCSVFNQPITFNTISVNSMVFMFSNCYAFDKPLSFNTGLVNNMSGMFQGCFVLNSPLIFTSTANVTNMAAMFNVAVAFNQNISSWNTGLVTNMSAMFQSALGFQQNIGSWNIANVTNFTNFMNNKTPATWPTAYFDNLLCGWSLQTVNPSLTIDFGSAEYTTLLGGPCRTVLQSAPNNWIINSGPGV